jgi:cytochrome c oxidase subunit 1
MEVRDNTHSGHAVAHDVHDHGHDDHHHDHHQTFITKYIFSTDHKMISKQFLVTAIIMAFLAMGMSMIFRLQLAWPDETFPFLESMIGKWGKDGKLDSGFYLALVTIHGTIMVFMVLTGGLSGTFSNLLIPLQVGARDMASGLLNMLSFWFFAASSLVMFGSLFIEAGPASGGWTVYPPLSALPQAIPGSGLGMTLWLVSMVLFIVSGPPWWY